MNWQSVKLGEAFWFQEGPGVRNWQFTTSGIKLLNVSNILKSGELDLTKTDKHLSVEEATGKYAHFLVDAGDLVIASSGISVDDDGFLRTRGAFVSESELPLCLNTSTIRFKAKEGVSTLEFLKHWINSVQFRKQISRLVTGTAQKNFGPSHLKAIEIPLPPLAEQERIAARLDAADRLRALRRDALARLNALTHSLFLEMFGDPAHNPMDWPIVKLGEHCQSVQTWSPKTQQGQFAYIDISSINREAKKIEATILTSCEDAPSRARQLVQVGDILVSTVRPNLNTVALVTEKTNRDTASTGFTVLRPHQTQLVSEYLIAFVRTEPFVNSLVQQARGISYPAVSDKIVKDSDIPLPPLSLQRRFAERLGHIERVRGGMERSRLELDALFAALQSAAFEAQPPVNEG